MKKLFGFLCLLLLLGFLPLIKLNALNISGEEVIKSATDVVKTDISGMATLNESTISTYNAGTITAAKLDTHATHWIEFNDSFKNMDARMVSYSGGTVTSWQGMRPTEIARLYEKEHPGWRVLAGINGDFFYIDDNCEPVGTFMQEGEFYKSYDYNDGTGSGGLGFKEDGTHIYGFVKTSNLPIVQLINSDGTHTDVADVVITNNAPATNGVSLLTRFALMQNTNKMMDVNGTFSYDLTGYNIYKVKYEVQRYDRQLGFVYLRGEVKEVVNDVTTLQYADSDGLSYLVEKDGSLSSLKVGDKIRVQRKAVDEWADVTNIMGVWSHILENNVTFPFGAYFDGTGVERPFDEDPTDYANPIKNRTVVGFKPDGSPVLLNVEMHSYGASYTECAAILRAIGCNEGYLFDGGGSSCMFIRTENGMFKTVNRQSDGNERRDANAILIVVRDPGFQINVDETRVDATVDLNVHTQETFDQLTNVKIKFLNKEYDYKGEAIKFENLTEDTEYKLEVSYSINGKKGAITKTFKTKDFSYPENPLSISKVGKNSITVTKDMTKDGASWITDVVVHVGAATYSMGNKETFVCDELIDDTEYVIYFTYTIVDPETSNHYPVTTIEDAFGIKTLSYEEPTFEKMEISARSDTQVTLAYKYVDPDRIVTSAILCVNGVEYTELTIKNSTVKIDLVKGDNKIKIILFCTTKEGKNLTIESIELNEVLTVDEPTPVTPPTPEKEETGKKKCGKKSAELIISLMALPTLLYFVIRKKR